MSTATGLEVLLYYSPVSGPSRAVVWFLARHEAALRHNGLPVAVRKIEVNLKTAENATPEYTAINAYQTVPILRVPVSLFCPGVEIPAGASTVGALTAAERGTGATYLTLTESGAILRWLSRLAGGVESPTLAADEQSCGLASALLQEAQLHHEHLARSVTVAQRSALNARKADPAVPLDDLRALVAKQWDEAAWALSRLNLIFHNRPWIAGNAFSIADYTVLAELSRLLPLKSIYPREVEEGLESRYPHVLRYLRDAEALEGWDAFVAHVGTLKRSVS